MDKTSLGDRMKAYEAIPKNYLMRRQPVIIRLDGKAFHNFTRGFDKPFDNEFMVAMQSTMKYLCENIQGCVIGYTQSDEISLVLCDYQKLDTDAWFGYNVQKMVSVAASMATFAFNNYFKTAILELAKDNYPKFVEKKDNAYKSLARGALFDARCFTVSVAEKGVNWNDLATPKKRGACCIKGDDGWEIDFDIPIFSQQPEYVNSRITFKED